MASCSRILNAFRADPVSEARPRLRNMHLGRLRCLSRVSRQLVVQRTWGRSTQFHVSTGGPAEGLRVFIPLAGPYSRMRIQAFGRAPSDFPHSLHNSPSFFGVNGAA